MEGNVGKSRNTSAEIEPKGGPLVDGREGNDDPETRLPKSPEMQAF